MFGPTGNRTQVSRCRSRYSSTISRWCLFKIYNKYRLEVCHLTYILILSLSFGSRNALYIFKVQLIFETSASEAVKWKTASFCAKEWNVFLCQVYSCVTQKSICKNMCYWKTSDRLGIELSFFTELDWLHGMLLKPRDMVFCFNRLRAFWPKGYLKQAMRKSYPPTGFCWISQAA